jgi:aldehyde dehydrogenase (NAD+)
MAFDLTGERLLIDGQLVGSVTGSSFDNVNPFTEEVFGVTADGGVEDLDLAVAAARRAFDETSWSRDHEFRARCLRQLQAAMTNHEADFAQLLVTEIGTPVGLLPIAQFGPPVAGLGWAAAFLESYEWEQELPAGFGGLFPRRQVREAAGVVGAITPWNYPIQINLAKCGPALAAGCTVVLKPAPDSPWAATAMGALIASETEIPPGVINIVASSSNAVSEALVADPRVDMISFTGATATGRRISSVAATTIKRVFHELGGKSACLVLDDADVAAQAAGIVGYMTMHAGQGCALTTRLVVPRARYDEAIESAKASMESLPYGDPNDPGVMMGPLISARQRDRVLAHIEQGRADGGTVVTGGGTPDHLPRGYFVEPTLFAGLDESSTLAQEEIFGPVLVVLPHDGDDDAVRVANNSIYGLSGSVFSASDERATAVARRIRTGTIGINGGVWFGHDSPFGGYKQSGVGREMGREGFEEYTEVKVLAWMSGA